MMTKTPCSSSGIMGLQKRSSLENTHPIDYNEAVQVLREQRETNSLANSRLEVPKLLRTGGLSAGVCTAKGSKQIAGHPGGSWQS